MGGGEGEIGVVGGCRWELWRRGRWRWSLGVNRERAKAGEDGNG